MAARKTKLNNFNQRKNCRNEVIALKHEAFRNASVTRPPQPPLIRPIERRQVVVVLAEFHCIYSTYPNDIV